MVSIPYLFFDISFEPNTKMYLWDPTPVGHQLAATLNDTLIRGRNENRKYFGGILEEHVNLAHYIGRMVSSDTDDLSDLKPIENENMWPNIRTTFRKFFPDIQYASEFGRWEIVEIDGVPPKVCIPVSYMTEV